MSVAHFLKDNDGNPFGEVITDEWLNWLEAETGIWDHSPQLQHVAFTAQDREVSAWGLLLSLQVHQLSLVEPNVVLVSRNGRPGLGLKDAKSLNMYAALLADTGGGKSDTITIASELVPPKGLVSGGTGQGLQKTFAETKLVSEDGDGNKIEEPYYVNRYLTNSAVIHVTEVADSAAEFGREGSSTASTLRKMWVGEITGATTGDVSRRVTLYPNTYRFGGIWGIQPQCSEALLTGAEAGTPQRWTWAPGEEFREDLNRTMPPQNVTFPVPSWNVGGNMYGTSGGVFPRDVVADTPLPAPIWVPWSPQMHADIPPLQAERKKLKRTIRQAKQSGKPLSAELERESKRVMMESHLILTRIKCAVALAFLHGRTAPTDTDWIFAGAQVEVSKRCLAEAWQETERKLYGDLTKRGTERGIEQHATQRSLDFENQRYVHNELAPVVWKKCSDMPLPRYRLANNGSTKQRQFIDEALELLIEGGGIPSATGQPKMLAYGNDGKYWAMYNGAVIEPPGMKFVPHGEGTEA